MSSIYKGCHRVLNAKTDWIKSKDLELYFLRLLLNHIKGLTWFADLRKVDEIVYPTFQLACKYVIHPRLNPLDLITHSSWPASHTYLLGKFWITKFLCIKMFFVSLEPFCKHCYVNTWPSKHRMKRLATWEHNILLKKANKHEVFQLEGFLNG